MSKANFKKEFEASFQMGGGVLFQESMIKKGEVPEGNGSTYIAYDPAGFADAKGRTSSKLRQLDEHAISIVTVSPEGWFVHDIVTGRWGVRETSLRLIRLCQLYKPAALAIEGGALKNAIMPYLQDQMKRLNTYPRVQEVTHGGQKKTDRITWALQGRMEHGKIWFKDGEYLNKFVDQMLDFPNPLAHDDMLDALAYIDQVARVVYADSIVMDQWDPIDQTTGY